MEELITIAGVVVTTFAFVVMFTLFAFFIVDRRNK